MNIKCFCGVTSRARRTQRSSIRMESSLAFQVTPKMTMDCLYLSRTQIERISSWPTYKSKDRRLYVCTNSSETISINLESHEIEETFITNTKLNCLRLFRDEYILSCCSGGMVSLFRPHDMKLIIRTKKIEYYTCWRVVPISENICVATYNGFVHPSNGFIMEVKLCPKRDDHTRGFVFESTRYPTDHTGTIWGLKHLQTRHDILISCGGGAHRDCRDYSLRKWNLKTRSLEKRFPLFHLKAVVSVDSYIKKGTGEELILSCSRDGTVVSSDLDGNVILRVHHVSEGDLEGIYVMFLYHHNKFFFGGMEGSIFYFDYDRIDSKFEEISKSNDDDDERQSGENQSEKKEEQEQEQKIEKLEESKMKKILPNVYYSKLLCGKKFHQKERVYRLEYISEKVKNVFVSCSSGGRIVSHKILDPMIRWKKDLEERIQFLMFDENGFEYVGRNHRFSLNILLGGVCTLKLLLFDPPS